MTDDYPIFPSSYEMTQFDKGCQGPADEARRRSEMSTETLSTQLPSRVHVRPKSRLNLVYGQRYQLQTPLR